MNEPLRNLHQSSITVHDDALLSTRSAAASDRESIAEDMSGCRPARGDENVQQRRGDLDRTTRTKLRLTRHVNLIALGHDG